MVFPLGVSVGDFISGIQLLRSTIKALNDARGARSNFQQLCASLESLETALALVAQLILTPDQASHKKAVVDAVGRCRQCADAFVEQIDRFEVLKFQTQSRWSLEKLGICLRKIQWSLLKKDDVDQFRADISAHTDALQMLMISFQIQDGTGRERRVTSFIAETNHCLNNLLAEEFSLQKIHAVGIRDDIHQQKLTLDTIDEKLSANRAIASSQSWALIDVKRHLENGLSPDEQRLVFDMLCETVGRNKTLIQQVTDVRNMIVMQRIPPPQVLLQEPVILHDARGRISPFHLDFINSTEAFLAVLRVRFQDLGRTKIERGEFSIEDTARNLDINLKQSWDRVFKPAQQVHMSMVFELQQLPPSTCPGCNHWNFGDCSLRFLKCSSCGLTYRKLDVQLQEVEGYLPPSSPNTAYSRATERDIVEENIGNFTRVRVLNKSQPPSSIPNNDGRGRATQVFQANLGQGSKGQGSRGPAIPKVPRVTKADRAIMEQEKLEHERMAAGLAGRSVLNKGGANVPSELSEGIREDRDIDPDVKAMELLLPEQKWRGEARIEKLKAEEEKLMKLQDLIIQHNKVQMENGKKAEAQRQRKAAEKLKAEEEKLMKLHDLIMQHNKVQMEREKKAEAQKKAAEMLRVEKLKADEEKIMKLQNLIIQHHKVQMEKEMKAEAQRQRKVAEEFMAE